MRSKKNKSAIAVLACLLAVVTNAVADTPRKIDVPPGRLTAALKALAAQSGVEFVYSTDQLEGLRTNGVHGELTAEQAVAKLLEGTKLRVTIHESGALLIAPPSSTSAAITGSPVKVEPAVRVAQSESMQKVAESDEKKAQADASSASAESEEPVKLEEIVVTAQKREERLRDVPISMSVMTGEQLDRSTAQGILESLKGTPGVAIYDGGGPVDKEVQIRGVGAGGFNSGAAPVSFYVDGSPFGAVMTSLVPDVNVYDLDRVEVLRGPQGTLYGASAQAGVVRVLTKDADLNDFEWKARANYSYTQYGGGNVRADTAVNLPIVEGKLAARAILGYQDLSGWIDKPTRADANDASVRNARFKLNTQLTDALKVGLSAWISRHSANAWSMTSVGTTRQSLTDDIDANGSEFETYALKVSYDASAFSLTSTTTYFDSFTHIKLAIGVPTTFAVDIRQKPQVFTQEFNLVSTQEGPWRWTAGAMYRDVEDQQYVGVPPLLVFPTLNEHTSQSWAIFGELTRKFLDGKLEFTAGLRHFQDEVGVQEFSRIGNVQPTEYISRDSTFDATTPRLILTWKPGRQMTVYASYAEGFRSGFQQLPANLLAEPSLPDVKPDTLTNYELGAKGDLFDGLVEYDVAAYYLNWNDVPLELYRPFAGTYRILIINGARAGGAGIDAGLTVKPVKGLQLGVTLGWNDLRVKEDVFSGGIVLYEKGVRLNRSAPRNFSASASYEFPLGESELQGSFAAGANLQSRWNLLNIIDNKVTTVVTSDQVLVGRVSFGVGSPRWQATLFVDNVNNEQDSPNRFVINTDRVTQLRPRTIGLQLEYRY